MRAFCDESPRGATHPAPRIVWLGVAVEVLGRVGSDPVQVRAGGVWGATLHPELTKAGA